MKLVGTLIEEEMLQKRIEELSKQIEKDYEGKEIVALSVLKGATFFTIDLAKHIHNTMNFEFIEVSSYGANTNSCGRVTLNKDIKGSIEGRDVLIIEDIIDTGRTMKYLIEHLQEKNPTSIKVASLLSKPERREIEIPIDYCGFDIPNKFVVGYGMDFDEKYRNLPYIGYME